MSKNIKKDPFWSNDDREFFKDTIRSVILFFLIASIALLLYGVQILLEYYKISPIITYSLKIIEYAILLCDVIWFIAKLISTTMKSVKRIYKDIFR